MVVFFPCSPDTGCTGTVLNVAAAAAAAGRRVLVVDGDFRRPGLAEQLGLADGGNGLGDVLGGSGVFRVLPFGLRLALTLWVQVPKVLPSC